MIPPRAALDAALAATWPAAEIQPLGPFTLRRSPGGGSRVIAATLDTGQDAASADPALLDRVDATMRGWGQVPTYRLRAGQAALDAALHARGFDIFDRSLFYAAPVAALAVAPPRLSAFDIWPPLAIQTELWAAGGIGPDRIAVMHRVPAPRTALFGRQGDRPAGTGFVAAHDGIAMLHALEIRPDCRRKGLARHMIAHAALWAADAGCDTLALAVTEANAPARALYAGLGMAEAGRYHYRKGARDA